MLYIIIFILLIIIFLSLELMKNTENYQGNRILIDQNIMINGDVLVDPNSDISVKKFDNLYVDGGVSLGDKAKEICLENKCFKHNELNGILNAQLPHFLYNDNETSRNITTTDDEISDGITPKKLCIGDYCITGEHLKILNNKKTSKLWASNWRGAALDEYQCDETLRGRKNSDYRGCQDKTRSGRTCQMWDCKHTNTCTHAGGSLGKINKRWNTYVGKTGIGNHNYCRNPDGEKTIWCYTTDRGKRWEYCDNLRSSEDTRPNVYKMAVIKDKSMATATGYPIGGNEHDFQFSFLPGRKTNIKCFSIENKDENKMD